VASALTRRTVLAGAALIVLPGCSSRSPATPATSASAGPPMPAAPPSADWRGAVRQLERDHDGRIGAWATDTGTGQVAGYREDERFPLLSTFKALAAAAVLDRGGLDRRIRWTAADRAPNSPVTDRSRADGLTLGELCHAAVTRSDNTAANLLLRRIGGPAGLTAYVRRLGDNVTRLDRWEPELNDWRPGQERDTTTAEAMGRTLLTLTRDRPQLTAWLQAAVTGDRRIRAGLPDDWTIGDKTGTGGTYGTANDVAIAQPPSGAPLVISVYTNRTDRDAARAESVIARTATILARALGG
jgi:beta-lactamase class A